MNENTVYHYSIVTDICLLGPVTVTLYAAVLKLIADHHNQMTRIIPDHLPETVKNNEDLICRY